MKPSLPAVVDVRGAGLLLGIELAEANMAEDVMYRCLANGLSFKVGQGNVIVLAPPLVIDQHDLDNALGIVEEAIGSSASG
jgi:4-aminobutyrate aminotransferase